MFARNSAVANSRIDISVTGVSVPLRRHTRNVKISISDSRGAQPVTVKRRADALNEHAASVIPGGTFWNFNEDWLPPSLRRFSIRDAFLGHRSLDYFVGTSKLIIVKRARYFVLRTRESQSCCFIDDDVLSISGKTFRKKRNDVWFLQVMANNDHESSLIIMFIKSTIFVNNIVIQEVSRSKLLLKWNLN